MLIGHLATYRALEHVTTGLTVRELVAANFEWEPEGWEYRLARSIRRMRLLLRALYALEAAGLAVDTAGPSIAGDCVFCDSTSGQPPHPSVARAAVRHHRLPATDVQAPGRLLPRLRAIYLGRFNGVI